MNSRNYFLILLLSIKISAVFGDSEANLENIKKNALSPTVKEEQLNKFTILLNEFQPTGEKDNQEYQEALSAVTQGYANINHFKPAYLIFKKYLENKEIGMSRTYDSLVHQATSTVQQKELILDAEMDSTAIASRKLKSSTSNYLSIKTFYQRFFPFTLVTLIFIFAIMLVRSGIKLLSMKKETTRLLEKINENHRLALIGRLSAGFDKGFKDNINEINRLSDQSLTLLNSIKSSSKSLELQQLIKSTDELNQSIKKLNN